MGLGDRLRRLDGTLLPPVGRFLRFLQAGTARRRALTSTALVAAAVLAVGAVWTAERPAHPVDDSGVVYRVGVDEGGDIPAYLDSSRAELEALAASAPGRSVWALVALTAYADPGQVTDIVAGRRVGRVYTRVPLTRAQTEIVGMDVAVLPDGLLNAMDATAERKDREAARYGDLAAKLTGGEEQERDQRQVYLLAQDLAANEADAYRTHCACAYAIVVDATPEALLAMAEDPFVRGVDPAPEIDRFERAVFLPPLPEQTTIAGPADSSLSDPDVPVGAPPGE